MTPTSGPAHPHDQSWVARYRLPRPTISEVLRSRSFLACRRTAEAVVQDPTGLRALARQVKGTIGQPGPLDAVIPQVLACEQFLLHRADELSRAAWVWAMEGDAELDHLGHLPSPDALPDEAGESEAVRSRRRLLVASLLYLVTVDDVVPDAGAGGYVDDALLIAWVAGVAARELSPFLDR